MKNILFIAPHLDDETIGCCGTIFRHKEEGDHTHCLLITKVKSNKIWSKNVVAKKQKELEKIKKIYKFNSFNQFNFKPGELKKKSLKVLVTKLSIIFKKIKPEIIYTPFERDIHTDHQIVTKAVLSASKWFRNKTIKELLMYETLSETNFNYNEDLAFRPNYFVDISKYLKKKLKICNEYKTEFKKHPFPRSLKSVEALAKLRGSESGYNAAESFKLVFKKI